jgi:hypothetical protein
LALKFDDVLLEIADGPAELEKANEASLTEILDVGLRTSPPLGYLESKWPSNEFAISRMPRIDQGLATGP